jgi:hypothetical protein
MRRVLFGLLTAASTLAAQAPATAPAPAPAAKVKGPTKAEFRVGGFMVSGERNYEFLGSTGTATGQIKGVEVLMRAPGIGLYVRSLSGAFGTQPKVISADARVLLGRPGFTLYGGVGRRALSGVVDKVYDFVAVGASSTISIGGSGVRTHIGGNIVLAPDPDAAGAGVKKPSKGIDAEAALFYRLPKTPFFMTVGYRTEVFNAISGSNTSPEEVRGLRLGGGISFGGR